MSFNWSLLFSPASLLLGLGLGCIGFVVYDKKFSKSGGSIDATAAEALANLQSELDAKNEEFAKAAEVHAYARTLEEKIQQLESTSESADSELRVKVLEKQLSEKADLESRLAVALQEAEDYKAKAEMYDRVMGGKTADTVAAPAPEPLAEETKEPEVAEVVAEEEPAEEKVAEPPVSPAAEEEVTDEAIAAALMAEVPTETATEPEPEEKLTAVASADTAIEIKLVENNAPTAIPSPAGSVAPAMDERPALRVESAIDPITDVKDPLEKIEGIGQIYQVKLYEAGIKTFAQLAASSPSRITEIIEPQNWQQIDVMKWRREAALYASGEKE